MDEIKHKFIEALVSASSPVDVDEAINRIARHSAKEALHDLGLDDPKVQEGFREVVRLKDDLKDMAQAWRALGWLRKALIYLGGLAAAVAATLHFFGNWPHK